MRREITEERFFSSIVKTPSGCWEWQKARSPQGYGKFESFGEQLAHRISYILHNGPFVNPKMCVCHKCDNPPCVNPDHLFLGTVADNNRDRDKKGRTTNPYRGITHCKRGHEFTLENTRIKKNGRDCRTCQRMRDKKRRGKV